MDLDKFYLVTRQDLALGSQAAQLCHAMRQFIFEHPEVELEWFRNSNYIVLLSVSDKEELLKVIDKAKINDIRFSIFREPDLCDELTAIALEPSKKSKKVCKNLKLAF